jgi:hypothetical protein
MEYDCAPAWPGVEPFASPAPLDDRLEPTNSIYAAAAPASAPDIPPFCLTKGTWFDEAIDFRDPEGDAVTKEVLTLIDAFEDRNRKRRQFDERKHYTAVRKILANGFRCHFHRRPHLVSYLRKADGYTVGPAWLSGAAMARTVDLMVASGLLDAHLGQWGETSSTYHIKPKLYGVAQACGITIHSLTHRMPPERLVRLREGNSKTPLIDFEPTDETRDWTTLLSAYNTFLAEQDIALKVTPEEGAEWVGHWNSNRQEGNPFLCHPELFKTDLYRQFNNGSFQEGGRLYGGWWINTPSNLRSRITINGRHIVELDFSGCAIRMLYHQRGIDYKDDPYWLEAVAAYEIDQSLKSGHFRDGIKALTQALINDRSGGRSEQIELPDGVSFRPYFTRSEIRRMIEHKHAPIADTFGTGAGLHLQRKDSDLALSIVTKLMELGIVVLPIHDSFITTKERKEDLLSLMNDEYKSLFGFFPLIKQI